MLLTEKVRDRPPLKRWRRRGYTMIELLVSLVGASILMAGLGSAIVITTQAVSPPGEQRSVLKAAEVTFIMADELQSSVHVVEQSATAVEFALSDRDGDGQTDIVRYEWDNTSHLLARHSENRHGTLLSDVSAFAIQPLFRSVPEELGGVVSESSQTTFNSSGSATGWNTFYVDPYGLIGQWVDVIHPSDTALWSISEVDLVLRRSSWYQAGERLIVQIREAAGDGLPTSTVLGESTILMSSLATSFQWKTLTFTGVERLPPDQQVCIVILGDSLLWGSAGRVLYASSGVSGNGYLVAPQYGYFDWHSFTQYDVYYRMRGTRHSFDPTVHEVERNYISGYDLELLHGTGISPVHRRVRLLNTPEHLSAVWRLDFNTDPTDGIDVDADGVEDWETVGSSLAESPQTSTLILHDTEVLQTSLSNEFAGLITADVRLRGLGSNATDAGGVVHIPFGVNGSQSGLITVRVSRNVQGNQRVGVVAADSGTGQILALNPNLADDFVDLRIVVDPVANQAAVWVNDVFQGRSVVTQPLSSGPQQVSLGAEGADAVFDFLSVRVGGVD